MLFYKRVEPEEENGKGFSFDVSPDLLEVRRLAVSGYRCMHAVLLSVLSLHVCLSVDLARQHAVSSGQEHI